MNVWRHELSQRKKSIIVWSCGLAVFMWTSLIKYETLSADPDATRQLLGTMPDTIKTIFGMNGLDAASLGGYVGICFLFVMILLAIHAGMTGSGVISREPLMNTTEFLYTKPLSRIRVLFEKLWAGSMCLVAVWGVTYLATWASIMHYASMEHFEQTLWLFMLATAIIQITFFCIGFGLACTLPRPAEATKIINALVFGSYAITMISQLEGYQFLRFFSILRYFDAASILSTSHLDGHYILVCIGLSVIVLVAAIVVYRRRDLAL